MKALIYANKSEAEAMRAKIDAAHGLPVDGVDIGGGIHAPPEQSRTYHFQSIIEHPLTKEWAAIVDLVDVSKLAGKDASDVDAAQKGADLTPDWFP